MRAGCFDDTFAPNCFFPFTGRHYRTSAESLNSGCYCRFLITNNIN